MDRKWIAGTATLAVMALSGMTVQPVTVQAQSAKPSTMPGKMKGPEASGRVVTVSGEKVTLDNGTELTVPKSQAKSNELKQGSMIKATYEERDGKKIVTSFQITEGAQAK